MTYYSCRPTVRPVSTTPYSKRPTRKPIHPTSKPSLPITLESSVQPSVEPTVETSSGCISKRAAATGTIVEIGSMSTNQTMSLTAPSADSLSLSSLNSSLVPAYRGVLLCDLMKNLTQLTGASLGGMSLRISATTSAHTEPLSTSYSTSLSLSYTIDFTFAATDAVSAAAFISALRRGVMDILSSNTFAAQLSQQLASTGRSGLDVAGIDPPSMGSVHYQTLSSTASPSLDRSSSSNSNASSSATSVTSQWWFAVAVAIAVTVCASLTFYMVKRSSHTSEEDRDESSKSVAINKLSIQDATPANLFVSSKVAEEFVMSANPGFNMSPLRVNLKQSGDPGALDSDAGIEMSTRIYDSQRFSTLDAVNPAYGVAYTVSVRPVADTPLEALPVGQEAAASIMTTIYDKGRISSAVDEQSNPAFAATSYATAPAHMRSSQRELSESRLSLPSTIPNNSDVI